ncbi:Xaa-Pro dipeptidyl-peptidase [Jiangella alkaliphila]|uniref:Xaa-Pro dipeptidyl-peptidase n=1 Tax=Jiangella alkaliphila TaxID=419479 RepID=A0A1H2KRB2_9ACTN|nr:Xaa-Pro dipeptidyl-peptidase [Jiangella alkaliphila]SDU71153.1 X-Pro dipeptidyl-peptidase [Jiangella alkaliphila]
MALRGHRTRAGAALAAAGICTAALLTAHGAATAAPAPAPAPAPAEPAFVDGLAQPVFTGPFIRHELWVETEFDTDGDGELDRMHVDVTRPAETDGAGLDVPVVYESSPYYSGTASTDRRFFWNVNVELGAQPPLRTSPDNLPEAARAPGGTSPVISSSMINTWVPRGFAVVHSESPGSGLSEGCPTVGGPNESLAPKAVVDWLNGRARGFTSADGGEEVTAYWSTGRVGMTGTSYNGTLPLAAATTGVEGLEVIIPVAPNTSYYHYYRSNGLVRSPGGWLGEDVDYLFDYINSGDLETRQYCRDTVRDVMQAEHDRVTGDYNDFWAGRDYLNQLDDVHAAVLMAHAFNDWNVVPEHSVRISEALEEKGLTVHEYFHQGGHGGNPPTDMMNRWFSQYLYGQDNGIEDDTNTAFVLRNELGGSTLTPYADYPNPAAATATLNLQAGGADAGGLTSLALADDATETLVDAGANACNAGLLATTPSANRLLYSTPTLTENVHLSGVTEVTVRLAASKARANLSVALVRLPWTGDSACASTTQRPTTSVITRGWADPLNRDSLTEEQPLTPGRFVDVTVPLQPDDQVIPAGSRIGLMIWSTDAEFTLRPQPGTELSVDLAGTTVALPVVGGPLALPICAAEDTRATVVIDGVDTGVPNIGLAGTCTVNDHVLDEEDWPNHGAFVRHTTQLADQLVAAGLIGGRDRGVLVRAAAQSDVG